MALVEGKPICEPIPGNCTLDQLYWSPDPSVPAECHPIGQRGPCAVGQVVTLDETGVPACSVPIEKAVEPAAEPAAEPDATKGPKRETKKSKATVVEPSPWEPLPCPLGSFRYQNNKCPT